MKLLLKWILRFTGLAMIVGTIIFGISANSAVPAGVDLGFEIFYLIAIVVGSLLVFLSTRIRFL